ncbi:RPOLCX [Musa troglodytarum]|uniref:RPOLCX n=1 Tax=Musa troglodytarum TaxID=320322 RepID=A0A9E7JF24_9LILI|nr:RPOLCX [Musa troglodytarum]
MDVTARRPPRRRPPPRASHVGGRGSFPREAGTTKPRHQTLAVKKALRQTSGRPPIDTYANEFWRSITRNFRNPTATTAKSESRSSSRRPVNRSAIRRRMTGPVRARSRRLSELCKRRQRLQTSPKRSRSSSFCSRVSTARSSSSVRASFMQTITLSSFGRLQIRRTKAPTKRGVSVWRPRAASPPLPSPPLLAGESFAVASWSESVGSTGSLASHPGLARVTLSPNINTSGGLLASARLRCHCGAENTLKPGDVIQCRECGYRILYKKRTRRGKIPFTFRLKRISTLFLRSRAAVK